MMRTAVLALVMAIGCATALGAQALTGQVQTFTVARGDTLRSLGSRAGVDPGTIALDNGLPTDAPLRVGATLWIDNRHIVPAFDRGVTIVVNVPQRMLFVATGGVVSGYPIAVGRPSWQTPLGPFAIVSKETDPTWDVPESIRQEARRAGKSLPLKVPPGPDNPLGKYWLGLSVRGIGIHGTNTPTSIFRALSHGCIRLQADDATELFGRVAVGTLGELVYEPVLVAVDGIDVFLEAHRDVYDRGPRDALEFVRARAGELGVSERVDWEEAAAVIQHRAGIARVITRGDQLAFDRGF
jgi:L,D-transpeptidase ErfK/SrfK